MSSMGNGMKAFFTVSILLNIMLVGVGGGMAYQHFTHDPADHISREMSPEARHIVARTMQNAFRDGRATMEQAREIKKEVKAVLSAEVFDDQKFMEEAQKMQDIKREMGKRRIEVTRDLAKQLSQDDRKILAERFSKGFHGYDGQKKGKKHPHAFLKEHECKPDQADAQDDKRPDVELPEDMPPQPEIEAKPEAE